MHYCCSVGNAMPADVYIVHVWLVQGTMHSVLILDYTSV
jgi:hypothetical protein